jgi:hypothetical protein
VLVPGPNANQAQTAQLHFAFGPHPTDVEHPKSTKAPSTFLPKEEVSPQAEVVDDRQVLIDSFDASVSGTRRAAEADFLAHQIQLSASRALVAGHDFQQSRFARPVVPHERNDFA